MYYDSTIPRWIGLFFILQKFGVTEYEVQRALLSNDPHDQLNIAYHLIVDNRRLAGEGKNILFSKSPLKILTICWKYLYQIKVLHSGLSWFLPPIWGLILSDYFGLIQLLVEKHTYKQISMQSTLIRRNSRNKEIYTSYYIILCIISYTVYSLMELFHN